MNPRSNSGLPAREWVRIGQLGSPHGVRGEIKLYPLSDVPGRFDHLQEVRWTDSGSSRILRVRALRASGSFFLIAFDGTESPEQAQALARGFLEIPRGSSDDLPPGRYFIDEMVGLTVEDETGAVLGTLTGIYQTGANDIYEISGAEGDWLLPALKSLVLGVDLKNRRMRVRVPEGLRS
jgi:16S rRNA processing protein RimM